MKKRREQREAEKAAMAEELELIQRERAIAEAVELEKKEEEVGGVAVGWFARHLAGLEADCCRARVPWLRKQWRWRRRRRRCAWRLAALGERAAADFE